MPDACPGCGNVDILPRGTGTERIEEELGKTFPGKRILRIDRDSVSLESYISRLNEILRHDILYGMLLEIGTFFISINALLNHKINILFYYNINLR